MNLEHYEIDASPEFTSATFISVGPRGQIVKAVQLSLIDLVAQGIEPGPTESGTRSERVFNLGFGDYDAATDQVNDTVNSNNGDWEKVLATVVGVAYEFCHQNRRAWVFAQGSTASRTRLYQIGLNRLYADLVGEFELFGYLSGKWAVFEQNVNYDAFLIRLK